MLENILEARATSGFYRFLLKLLGSAQLLVARVKSLKLSSSQGYGKPVSSGLCS